MNIGKSVKKLLIRDCANYDEVFNNIKDYCCLEWTKGYRCIFFIRENAECGYFEKAVLPMNPQLEALYKADIKARQVDYKLSKEDKERIVKDKSPVAGKVKIHCKKCKWVFLADHYNQKYCESCKEYLTKKRWREQKQKEKNREREKENPQFL